VATITIGSKAPTGLRSVRTDTTAQSALALMRSP
jgi:hypothetical protein